MRLRSLPAYYKRPGAAHQRITKSQLGLPESGTIYLCTQNLRKFHPEFDQILEEILRRDQRGWLCVIADSQPAITKQLLNRWSLSRGLHKDRVVVLNRRRREEYLHYLYHADVVLDTTHYGGGANSHYDAFACGAPIVTLPGDFHRGRYGLGICRYLGLDELIALNSDDYVIRAVRIAQHSDYRSDLSARIQTSAEQLFENPQVVDRYRDFLLRAIQDGRAMQTRQS